MVQERLIVHKPSPFPELGVKFERSSVKTIQISSKYPNIWEHHPAVLNSRGKGHDFSIHALPYHEADLSEKQFFQLTANPPTIDDLISHQLKLLAISTDVLEWPSHIKLKIWEKRGLNHKPYSSLRDVDPYRKLSQERVNALLALSLLSIVNQSPVYNLQELETYAKEKGLELNELFLKDGFLYLLNPKIVEGLRKTFSANDLDKLFSKSADWFKDFEQRRALLRYKRGASQAMFLPYGDLDYKKIDVNFLPHLLRITAEFINETPAKLSQGQEYPFDYFVMMSKEAEDLAAKVLSINKGHPDFDLVYGLCLAYKQLIDQSLDYFAKNSSLWNKKETPLNDKPFTGFILPSTSEIAEQIRLSGGKGSKLNVDIQIQKRGPANAPGRD